MTTSLNEVTTPSRAGNMVYPLNQQILAQQPPFAATPIQHTDVWVLRDDSKVTCEFNVMTGKPVRENFYIKEYRIFDLYAEATLDRDYFSSMEKSPDHLIFVTGQVHTQKLLYLTLLKYFGFEKHDDGKEHLKIWPTEVRTKMPRMVRDNHDVVQKLWVTSVEHIRGNQYTVKLVTTYNGIVTISADCAIYLI